MPAPTPSPNHLLITRKYREWISAGVLDATGLDRLQNAPCRRKHVLIDLADDCLRSAIELASKRFLSMEGERLPPALVGSARKVSSAIARYEQRRSNLDLFEDHPYVNQTADRV